MGVKDGKKYILPPSGEDVFLFEVAKGSRVALDLMCIIHMLVPYHYHGLFTKSPHDEASTLQIVKLVLKRAAFLKGCLHPVFVLDSGHPYPYKVFFLFSIETCIFFINIGRSTS